MIQHVLLYGNVTIDHNITESGKYTGPGGSVYFMAKTLANLNVFSTIVSPLGKDFPKKLLPKTSFYPNKSQCGKTLIFKNIHNQDGTRTQWVENCQEGEIIKVEKIEKYIIKKSDTICVAPILDNLSTDGVMNLLASSKRNFSVLLPQGFYRSVDKKRKIFVKEWQDENKIVEGFNIIVVSDKDYPQVEQKAEEWSKLGSIVIVTKEDKGCSVYQKGKGSNFPAYYVSDIVDSTGAGDVFAAAFVFSYIKSRQISHAAKFANATAALSLKFTSDKLNYKKEDVERVMKGGEKHGNIFRKFSSSY